MTSAAFNCLVFGPTQRPPRNSGGFGGRRPDEDEILGLEEEDDIVAADLDMHSLILTSNPQDSAVSSVLLCRDLVCFWIYWALMFYSHIINVTETTVLEITR